MNGKLLHLHKNFYKILVRKGNRELEVKTIEWLDYQTIVIELEEQVQPNADTRQVVHENGGSELMPYDATEKP